MQQFPFSFLKSSVLILPRVGPYAALAVTPISGLSDLTVSVNTAVLIGDNNSPAKYKDVVINAGISLYSAELVNFFWVNKITGSAGCKIGRGGYPGVGDDGGAGISGGGAGGAKEENEVGWSGGGEGTYGGTGGFDNNGGQGFGQDWQTYTFAFGNGGSGGAGGNANGGSVGGAGGAPDGLGNSGGGGGGGSVDQAATGYGGGGGGDIIGVVCNQLLGSGTFYARGGDGAGTEASDVGAGGSGGGGVIWVAAKKYTGGWTTNVLPGTQGEIEFGPGGNGTQGDSGQARIYEINSAGTTLTLRAFNESWDNT